MGGRCVRRGYLKSRITGEVFARGPGSGESIQSQRRLRGQDAAVYFEINRRFWRGKPGGYFVATPLTDELILGSIHPTFPWWANKLLFFATVGSIVTVLSQSFPHLCCHTLLKQIVQQIHPQLASPPGLMGFCAVDLNRWSSCFSLPC